MGEFKKVNEGEVVSSSGFSIKISHNKLSYKEGVKALSLDIEHATNPYRIVVYTNTMSSWYRPFERELLTTEKKKEIVERIICLLDFLGTKYELEE